jgi:hypothetical protein
MPRSTNINTYDAVDRALLSPQFVDSLAGGSKYLRLADKREAQRQYFRILAVIRAARETGTDMERLMSMTLGVRAPTATIDPDDPAATPIWVIELYDRNGARANDPLAALVEASGAMAGQPTPDASEASQGASSQSASPQDDQIELLRKLGYVQVP